MFSRMYTYRERESERVNRDLIIIAVAKTRTTKKKHLQVTPQKLAHLSQTILNL